MTLSLIAAMTKHGRVIGKDGKLPWHLPEDMALFKRLTKGHVVIMGRKTYESIPEKFRPLPGRINIILSRQKIRFPGADVVSSVQEAIKIAEPYNRDMFVIGGSQIYKLFLNHASSLHFSFVKEEYEGDTTFPQINLEEWQVEETQDYTTFEYHKFTRKVKNNAAIHKEMTNMTAHETEKQVQKTTSSLQREDPEVAEIIIQEEKRQQNKLSMIPSENFFSKAVREATGSVLAHKYAEGNIGRRYYEGNKFIDQLEKLTIERAKQAFNLPKDWSVNVQALSGSTANLAVYLALLNIGDYIMGMYLPDGGHLSHGWSFTPKQPADPSKSVYYGGKNKVNISSKIFNTISYKTNPKTQLFDYDEIERIALLQKPKLIITGGTAYPRDIDYQRMRKIADKIGAYYLADIAHEAGLISAGAMKSPVGIADIVTLTTHKTLKSGRGAMIFAHEDIIKKINKAILPGLLGGPFNHGIAGICVGLKETQTQKFKDYAHQTVKNAQYLCAELAKCDFNIVSGGTDKHLVLIDLTNKELLGKKFARALDHAGIVGNYNTIPQETKSPLNPSGLRLGTPWITMRGMKEEEVTQIAEWIHQVLRAATKYKDLKFKEFNIAVQADTEIQRIAREVEELCQRFPLKI